MNLSIIQVSARRYVVASTSCEGSSNLFIFSGHRLGQQDEMIGVPKTKILTHKLDHEHAMLMFCLLSQKAELTERQWGYVIQEQEDEVLRYHQLQHYGAYRNLAIPEPEVGEIQ